MAGGTAAGLLAGGGGVLAVRLALRRRRRRLPGQTVILSPRKSTVVSREGAVHSVQTAELTMNRAELERLWTPPNLENLARTYWAFLSRVTLHLVRVLYSADSRSVVLVARPATLLRFDAPHYEFDAQHGLVSWRIRDGLLVARSGRGSGYLALGVRRLPDPEPHQARVLIEVEVANFYPAIAAGLSTPAYEMTQSVIHVLVTHAFLRSLATLELAESRVGRLAELLPQPDAPSPP